MERFTKYCEAYIIWSIKIRLKECETDLISNSDIYGRPYLLGECMTFRMSGWHLESVIVGLQNFVGTSQWAHSARVLLVGEFAFHILMGFSSKDQRLMPHVLFLVYSVDSKGFRAFET